MQRPKHPDHPGFLEAVAYLRTHPDASKAMVAKHVHAAGLKYDEAWNGAARADAGLPQRKPGQRASGATVAVSVTRPNGIEALEEVEMAIKRFRTALVELDESKAALTLALRKLEGT